jgi:hypothetical protein
VLGGNAAGHAVVAVFAELWDAATPFAEFPCYDLGLTDGTEADHLPELRKAI